MGNLVDINGNQMASTKPEKPQKEDVAPISEEEKKMIMEKLESTREEATEFAMGVNYKMRGNWFTAEKLMKKFKLTSEQANIQLLSLSALGLATRKIVNDKNGNPKEFKWKIILSDKDRLTLFRDHLAQVELEKKAIEEAIADLESKIKERKEEQQKQAEKAKEENGEQEGSEEKGTE